MGAISKVLLSVAVLSLVVAGGCSGGGGGGGGPDAPGAVRVSGTAVKGPVANGDVSVHRLYDNGAPGPVIATGTTGADGSFDVDVGSWRGPVLVCVTGGTYTNERTGGTETIPADRPLCSVAEVGDDGAGGVVVTPLTTLSWSIASELAATGDSGMAQASRNADLAVREYFGGVDPRVLPADLGSSALAPGAATDAALAIGALSQIAIEATIVEMDLVTGLGIDFADFTVDGTFRGTPVEDAGGPALPVILTPSELANAVETVLGDTGLSPGDTTIVDAIRARPEPTLPAPPRPVAVKGTVTTTDGGGFAAVQFRDTIDPGTLQVLIESRFVEITVDAFEEVGVDFVGFAAPAGLGAGLYDLRFLRPDTGQETTLAGAYRVVDPSAAPTVSSVSPSVVSTAGGERIRVATPDALGSTEVDVDGVDAPVVNVVPGRYLEFALPPGTGPGNVTVRNSGPSTTVSGALDRQGRGLGAAKTIDPGAVGSFRIYGHSRFFEGTTPVTRTFETTFTPSNSDTGTFVREVREYRPSGEGGSETITGTAFFQNQGEALGVLEGSGPDQLFHLLHGSREGVMSGLHASGQSMAMDPATSVSLADLAGDWSVAGVYDDYEPSTPRYGTLVGRLTFDGAGFGGLSGTYTSRDVNGDRSHFPVRIPLRGTAVGDRFEIDLEGGADIGGATGLVVRPNRNSSLLAIRGATPGSGALSLLAIPSRSGLPAEAGEGAFVGGTIGVRPRDGAWKFDYDLARIVATVTGRETQTFSHAEETSRVTAIEPQGEFGEKLKIDFTRYLGVNGVQYRDDYATGVLDPELGIGVSVKGFGLLTSGVKLEVSPTLTGDRRYVSLAVSPTVEGFQRFETHQQRTTIGTDVRMPDGGTISLGGLTKRTERSTSGGVPFLAEIPLVGNLFAQRTATRTRNELTLFVRPQILLGGDDEAVYGVSPRIRGDAESDRPETRARGVVDAGNGVMAMRDAGEGEGSELRFLLDGTDAGLPISGTYRAGGVLFSFAAGTGAFSATAYRGTVQFDSPSAGAATFSLVSREEREDGSAVAGTVTGAGAWSIGSDGEITLTLPDGQRAFTGGATADGQLLVLVERTLATRAGILVLVGGAGTPVVGTGNYSGMSLEFRFTDTGTSPAAWAVSTGERVFSNGLGAVNVAGVVRERTTAGGDPALQQLFATSTMTVNGAGVLTLQVGNETRTGGMSGNGRYGFAVPGTSSVSRVSIDLVFAE